jgi:DNA ligase (NAD+)
VLRFFSDEANIAVVNRLQSYGLNLHVQYDPSIQRSDALAGKSFLVSGTFSMSRDDLKKLIENNGGRNVSAISKSLDYLIAGDKMGPEKLKKAAELNIKIISEQDFLAMI